MVHKVPENFNISDFDVFHSALLYTDIIDIWIRVKINQNFWQKLETLVKRGGRKGERAELKMRTELFKVI